MRPIFDCRETAMGLCRLPSTVCERVGERWRAGAGSFAILGIRSLMLAHTLARGGRCGLGILGDRETVMGLRPRRCTVCERVGERLCDGAG